MKLILENWRRYLAEELVKFSGILKLMPGPEAISEIETAIANLPEKIEIPQNWDEKELPAGVDFWTDENGTRFLRVVPLPEDKWHVTLAHQSVLKPYRKQLKRIDKAGEMPSGPQVILLPEVEEREDDELRRKSWVVWLENQDEMRDYVNQIMEMVGGPLDPEPNRRFHISLANLTGNPGDSVR